LITIRVDITVLFIHFDTSKADAVVAYTVITRRYDDIAQTVDYPYFASFSEIR